MTDRRERHAVIWMVIYIVSACLIALAFCSCKTKIVTVEKVHDVYHNVTDTIRDSISHTVYVNQYVKGDTVFRDKVEYLYKDRWRVRDSIVIQRDSVAYPVEVIKYKKKGFSLWQYLLIGGAFLIIVFKVAKLIAKIRNWDGW